jgi:hypothetical protein
MPWRPDDDDDELDPEGPQSIDLPGDEDDEETPTLPCPGCGAEVAELAERCPNCGTWIESRSSAPRPWVIGTAAALLVALLIWWSLR